MVAVPDHHANSRIIHSVDCPSCEEEFQADRGYSILTAFVGRIYFCSRECKVRWRETEMVEADEFFGETLQRGQELIGVDDYWFDWYI